MMLIIYACVTRAHLDFQLCMRESTSFFSSLSLSFSCLVLPTSSVALRGARAVALVTKKLNENYQNRTRAQRNKKRGTNNNEKKIYKLRKLN